MLAMYWCTVIGRFGVISGLFSSPAIDLGKPKSVASVIYLDVANTDYIVESATYGL